MLISCFISLFLVLSSSFIQCLCFLVLDVGACEKISKGKTESDFSEMLRTEHCETFSCIIGVKITEILYLNY